MDRVIKRVQKDLTTNAFVVRIHDKLVNKTYVKKYTKRLPLRIRFWLWKHRSTKLTRENVVVWSDDYFVYHG